MTDTTAININLLNKNYQLKCPAAQVEHLKQAAAYLDKKIQEKTQATNSIGVERPTILAALDICYELVCLREEKAAYDAEINARLKNLHERMNNLVNAQPTTPQTIAAGEQQQLDI